MVRKGYKRNRSKRIEVESIAGFCVKVCPYAGKVKGGAPIGRPLVGTEKCRGCKYWLGGRYNDDGCISVRCSYEFRNEDGSMV